MLIRREIANVTVIPTHAGTAETSLGDREDGLNVEAAAPGFDEPRGRLRLLQGPGVWRSGLKQRVGDTVVVVVVGLGFVVVVVVLVLVLVLLFAMMFVMLVSRTVEPGLIEIEGEGNDSLMSGELDCAMTRVLESSSTGCNVIVCVKVMTVTAAE
jgi:hypothetical protein